MIAEQMRPGMAFIRVRPTEFFIYFIVGVRRGGGGGAGRRDHGTMMMHVDFIRMSSLVNVPFIGEWTLCHSNTMFSESGWELM
jgi:hypothetical protein